MIQNEIQERVLTGVQIVFKFQGEKPSFGDLFLMTGDEHPDFSPTNEVFSCLEAFEFTQVDDFFGIENPNLDEGGDVIVWLFPQVDDEDVYHHDGPFDAIKLSYDVVRNAVGHQSLLESIFNTLNENLKVDIYFQGEAIHNFELVKTFIDEAVQYCQEELGVEPGSDEALMLDE